MVRVLLIRHGTTESNLRDARMAIAVARGDTPRDQAPRAIREQLATASPDEQCGDTHLSVYKGGGREQAALLAPYWSPILRGKAESGGLHIFVSAMQRCMQTADPLMTSLGIEVRAPLSEFYAAQ